MKTAFAVFAPPVYKLHPHLSTDIKAGKNGTRHGVDFNAYFNFQLIYRGVSLNKPGREAYSGPR